MVFRFDEAAASAFRPLASFEKTAILAKLKDETATTTICTTFGDQVLRGSFYLVADGEDSYGAAKAEFEHSHTKIGPSSWVKHGRVLAYQVDEPQVIETMIDAHVESIVEASRGDWIVRQDTGEVIVLTRDAFGRGT